MDKQAVLKFATDLAACLGDGWTLKDLGPSYTWCVIHGPEARSVEVCGQKGRFVVEVRGFYERSAYSTVPKVRMTCSGTTPAAKMLKRVQGALKEIEPQHRKNLDQAKENANYEMRRATARAHLIKLLGPQARGTGENEFHYYPRDVDGIHVNGRVSPDSVDLKLSVPVALAEDVLRAVLDFMQEAKS